MVKKQKNIDLDEYEKEILEAYESGKLNTCSEKYQSLSSSRPSSQILFLCFLCLFAAISVWTLAAIDLTALEDTDD